MKIRIVTPALNNLALLNAYQNSIQRLISIYSCIQWEYIVSFSSEIGMGRSGGICVIKTDTGYTQDPENLVSKILPDFDYVFSVDSDISFDPSHFMALLDHSSKNLGAVICGAFAARCNPSTINAGFLIDGLPIIDRKKEITTAYYKQVEGCIPVMYSSFGFSLIPREVLLKTKRPWFANYVHYYNDLAARERYIYVHEDLAYSMALNAADIPLLVCPGCFVEHIGV